MMMMLPTTTTTTTVRKNLPGTARRERAYSPLRPLLRLAVAVAGLHEREEVIAAGVGEDELDAVRALRLSRRWHLDLKGVLLVNFDVLVCDVVGNFVVPSRFLHSLKLALY